MRFLRLSCRGGVLCYNCAQNMNFLRRMVGVVNKKQIFFSAWVVCFILCIVCFPDFSGNTKFRGGYNMHSVAYYIGYYAGYAILAAIPAGIITIIAKLFKGH